ncbi:hypothetical protein [uncultured Roseobacter sp.]|nr:hypothetical protein [uncultured Roseobacter sp.]
MASERPVIVFDAIDTRLDIATLEPYATACSGTGRLYVTVFGN